MHPLDPNNLALDDDVECRIYTKTDLSEWVVVDEIDYWWACRWCWHICPPSPRRKGKKQYARRNTRIDNVSITLYLHIEVMKKTGIPPPSLAHTLVNHINGNERNCKRNNIEWQTTKGNHKGVRHDHRRKKRAATD